MNPDSPVSVLFFFFLGDLYCKRAKRKTNPAAGHKLCLSVPFFIITKTAHHIHMDPSLTLAVLLASDLKTLLMGDIISRG